MRKLWRNIVLFFHGLFHGMRGGDVITLQQTDNSSNSGMHQTVESETNVMSSLLQRKETQEVKELRDITYRVYIESGHYEVVGDVETDSEGNPYFTNVRGERKSLLDITPTNIYMEKTDKLITIQDNWLIVKGAGEAIDDFIENDEDIDAGYDRYKLNIIRDYIPRFKLEKYTKRLVIKEDPEFNGISNRMILEFYCSIYPRQFEKEDVFFLNECKKLVAGATKSDIVDFDEMEFITEKAFMLDDIHMFHFAEFKYLNTIEYDGNYIIRMSAYPVCNYVDLTAEYRTAEVDAKYATKEKRTDTFAMNAFTMNADVEPPSEIDNLIANSGKSVRIK